MKRVIALLLSLMMIVMLLPISAFADTTPSFSIESGWAMPGSTANVNVTIANNPGLIATNLIFSLPEGVSIVEAVAGDAFSALKMTAPAQLERGEEVTNLCRFTWFGNSIAEDDIKDGVILTLKVKISETAKLGEELAINISSEFGDSLLNDGNPIKVNTVGGNISVIDYTPGDVNQDGRINMQDVVMLSRYIVDGCVTDPNGYNIILKKEAADINADGRINMQDVVNISRYVVDNCKTDPKGYNVRLLPAYKPCEHSDMEHFEATDATCTKDGNIEYWHCTKCDKYFTDVAGNGRIEKADAVLTALGHDVVIDAAIEPTYTSTGLTEGSHCARCKEVLVKQSIIPKLVKEQYAITYSIANGDAYLAAQSIENPNDAYYTSSDGYTLKNISVPGYRFLGWYDLPSGSNAVNIKKIPVGEKGEIELYAHWEKIEYTVQFKSNLIPVDTVSYTVDKGVALPTPHLDGYVFAGWSNGDGEVLESLPVGTLGDAVLSANWISERNKAWAKRNIGKPIVIEDKETNSILFTYEIGRIENVPLYVIEDFGYINAEGVSKEISKEYTVKVDNTLMQQSAKSIADSTTSSAHWSLSSGWSDQVSVNENYLKEQGLTETDAKTIGTTDSSNWLVSTGQSGSTTETVYASSQDYDLHTTTSNTKTYDVHDDKTDYKVNAQLDVGYEHKTNKFSAESLLVGENSFSADFQIGGEFAKSNASKTGTETDEGGNDQTGSVKHTGTDRSSSSSWNSSSSYGGSRSVNQSDSFSKTVSEKIASEYGYGKSYINNGEETNQQGKETSTSSSNSYTAAVTYSLEETNKETIKYSTTNTKTGYHRLIKAGTAHVFAVVGYNIETASYFISTYTVMDDEMHNFEDYSYQSALYDDNQNGVIPFEVPYEVEEYVLSMVGETDGLEFNKSGVVTSYGGSEKNVVIPKYHVVENSDKTRSVVKVAGISATAFKGNKDITGVELSDYITEIPANAFEGCSSLTYVGMPGVISIGDKAFMNCTQLDSVLLSKQTKSIGKNAFDNIITFGVYTDSLEVIDGAINSGAKNVYVFLADSISYLPEATESNGRKELTIGTSTDKFVLNGCGKTLENIVVKSDAKATAINNVTIKAMSGTPLKISSPKVQLGQVTVDSAGIAIMLTNENCELELYGESMITSSSQNGMLCRNVNVAKADAATEKGVYSELEINGDILACGKLSMGSLIKCNGSIITINEADYAKYVKGMFTVAFDANEGTVGESSRVCYYGSSTDKLPVPVRTGFDFAGWYTAREGGNEINESTISTLDNDCVLYAHWMPKEYTVNWTDVDGVTITVKRTDSPNADAGIGILTNNDKIYYGDVLNVTYTEHAGYTVKEKGEANITVNKDITAEDIYAITSVNSYTVSWETGTGYSIAVERTSSPYAKQSIGNLSNGDAIYYGDILSVKYSALTGYSIGETGSESITVVGNVSSDKIHASASPNSYTYNIVYKSSNGTNLGSSTVTNKFGTTNKISPPAKSGYSSPAAQTVKWDSVTAKTITMIYTPSAVSSSQFAASGTWWDAGYGNGITYSATIQYQNRTANSVQVRVVWTQSIKSAYYGFNQYFYASCGGQNTGNVLIASTTTWPASTSRTDSRTVYSGWMTVPVSATATSAYVACDWWTNGTSHKGSWGKTISIPTY